MRVLNPIGGTAAVRCISDEVLPQRGFLQRDLIEFVAQLYAFHVRPALPPNVPALPVLQFQAGKAIINREEIIIQQLVIFPDGDAVVAQTTDLAQIVMEDLLTKLDAGLAYRYREARLEWVYTSALAVEFDARFVERTSAFAVMQRAANEATRGALGSFGLKRLAFGTSVEMEAGSTLLVGQFARSDFSLERRATVPLEHNVFFSTAPLRTSDHEAYLERIEREAIS